MSADPLAAAAFAALLERTAGDILLIVDDGLRITRAGAGAAGLAQRPAEELLGMSLIAAFGSAPLDVLARRAWRDRSPSLGEADLGPRAGRAFAVDAVPLASGVVLALHEITALRRAERVRRDFVTNISHELRTPTDPPCASAMCRTMANPRPALPPPVASSDPWARERSTL